MPNSLPHIPDTGLAEILERISDAFVALDKNWCYTYMNKKAGEIFHRDPKQMTGKHIWTEFPEGLGQPFHKAYEKAMKEQQYVYLEEYYAPYDLWFENHIYPSQDGLSIFFRDITEKKKAEETLERDRLFIESLINASPDIIYIYDIEERKNVYINEGMQYNLGYSDDEIKQFGDQVLPILMPKEDFDDYLQNTYPRYATLKDKEILTHEFRMRHKNGNWHWLYTKESIFLRKPEGTPKQIFGITTDITENKKMDLILAGEKKIMEMIATEKQLEEILNTVALNYESYSDNALCSIQLLNEKGTHLMNGAAPSLPDAYNKKIDGLAIGPLVGSCGRAAYLKERVIVSDIATDPLWVNYRDFTLGFGLKACWSTPIINTEGKVYGTFAIYYKECRKPDDADLILIDRAANQVKIVLERYYKDNQIKESEVKYRTLVEQASDAIFIADTAGRFITVNSSACKLAQYTEAELLQMSIYDFAVMEDIQKNPFHFDELKQGKTVITERLMKGKNGIPLHVEINAKLLTDGRLLTFVRDITERKKAEKALSESENRLRIILQTEPECIKLIDQNGDLTYMNPAGLAMMEADDLDMVKGKTGFSLIKETYRDAYFRLCLNVFKGIPGKLEYEITGLKGTPRWLETHVVPLRDAEEKITSLLGVTRDITEHKKAAEEIKERIIQLQMLSDNLPDTMMYQLVREPDGKMKFTYISKTVEKLTGKTQDEVIQNPQILYNLIHEDDRQKMTEAEEISFRNMAPFNMELRSRIYSGDIRWLHIRSVPRQMDDGRIIWDGIHTDITERKKAEEKLQKSEELFSGAFHASPAGIIITRIADGKIIDANESFLEMFEFSREETIGHTSIELNMLSPGERTKLIQQQFTSGGLNNFELLSKTKSGKPINLFFSSKPLEINNEACHITTLIDITERKKAEEALTESNLSLSEAHRIAKIGSWTYYNIGGDLKWSDNIYQLYGLPSKITDTTPDFFFALVHPDDREKMQKWMQASLAGDAPGEYEFRSIFPDGSIHYYSGSGEVKYDTENTPVYMRGTVQDITERKKAEEEIKNTAERLRQLTAHLQTIRDEERKHIAREIHDELGQQLTAVKMDVAWIDKNTGSESKIIKSKLKNTISLLDMSNLSIRKILTELRTGIMNNRGLTDALEWQGKQFTETTGIPVSFKVPKQDIVISESIANCIFRVYQEALTNIARYAKAGKVKASLICTKNTIKLMVEDDGKGFDMAVLKNKRSFGILGMKERVASLNGTFQLTSSPGKGTKINAAIPLVTDKKSK